MVASRGCTGAASLGCAVEYGQPSAARVLLDLEVGVSGVPHAVLLLVN
jgi:hypothetical protein